MLSAFGSIPDLSLCVEHGFNFRLGNGSWQQLVHEVDNTWREVHYPANRPTQKPVRSLGGGRWAAHSLEPPSSSLLWSALLQVAGSIMNVYATRTHGAYVQIKGSSIVFNFGEADPEFGKMNGKELQTTLNNVLAAFPVVVRRRPSAHTRAPLPLAAWTSHLHLHLYALLSRPSADRAMPPRCALARATSRRATRTSTRARWRRGWSTCCRRTARRAIL